MSNQDLDRIALEARLEAEEQIITDITARIFEARQNGEPELMRALEAQKKWHIDRWNALKEQTP